MLLALQAKASLLLAYVPRSSFGSSVDSIAQVYVPVRFNRWDICDHWDLAKSSRPKQLVKFVTAISYMIENWAISYMI